jgi:hypothetical protein
VTNVRAFSARRIAAASLIAASLVGVSACSTINEQATTKSYEASDGISATVKSGSTDIVVRNLMIVANGKDKPGRILGTVVNNGTEKATVTFSVNGTASTKTIDVEPAPNNSQKLTTAGNTVLVASTPVGAGQLTDVTVSVNGQETTVKAPVLDGTLEQYRQYIPGGYTPAPTPSATASASGH